MIFNYGTKIFAGNAGGIAEESRELTKKFSLKLVASQMLEQHQNAAGMNG